MGRTRRHGLVGEAPQGARGFPGDGWRDRAESGLRDGPDLYLRGLRRTNLLLTPQMAPTGVRKIAIGGSFAVMCGTHSKTYADGKMSVEVASMVLR